VPNWLSRRRDLDPRPFAPEVKVTCVRTHHNPGLDQIARKPKADRYRLLRMCCKLDTVAVAQVIIGVLPEWRASEQASGVIEAIAQEIADAMQAVRGARSDPDNLLRGQTPGECPAGESRACHLCFRRSLLGAGFFGGSRCERHAPEICARCSQRQSPILRLRSGAKMY
jgi:hypothetical protein